MIRRSTKKRTDRAGTPRISRLETNRPPRFQQTIRKVIQYDLDWIEERCDALVAYWDEFAEQGEATHGELTVAYRRGMPVYLVTKLPVGQVSGWILGCASQVFPGFAELREYLANRRSRAPLYA